MVALDTGSDLFWVQCDCSRCATTQALANYVSGGYFFFRILSLAFTTLEGHRQAKGLHSKVIYVHNIIDASGHLAIALN
uniref:Peptidase A1 domain-containing protein n=1 Tax=Rhizophora mucronata TaxID=61149 RepID=A0A2P2KJC8_RHIMU